MGKLGANELIALERERDKHPEDYPGRADYAPPSPLRTIAAYWEYWTPERLEHWRQERERRKG